MRRLEEIWNYMLRAELARRVMDGLGWTWKSLEIARTHTNTPPFDDVYDFYDRRNSK